MGKMVDEVSRRIFEKRIKGSSDIALESVNALLEDAKEYLQSGGKDFNETIIRWAIQLKESRPSLITLQNGIAQAVSKIEYTEGAEDGKVLELLKSNVEKFRANATTAEEEISKIGANIIQGGDEILTISHSKMILAILKKAISNGKNPIVWVAETRPRFQGVEMSKAVSELGIETNLIVDSAVRHYIKRMDLVFVGADTISSDGSVITKIGSSQIALIAQEARVPFYVAAPTYKFSVDTFSGIIIRTEENDIREVIEKITIVPEEKREDYFSNINVRNPSFDVTPPEYIRGIITEKYIMSPYSVGEYVAKQYYFQG